MVEEPTNGTGVDVHGDEAEIRALAAGLKTLQADIMLARSAFARATGFTFDNKRDMYGVLGYRDLISTSDYRTRYQRGGIAARIVDAMPDACWRGSMELIEDESKEEYTKFEQSWHDFDQRLQVQAKLRRVDKLAGLSTFSVLLIGAGGDMEQPLPRGNKQEQILYLTPFAGGGGPTTGNVRADKTVADGSDASVFEYETEPSNPRFGLPKSYQLKRLELTSLARPVHWTRIIHIAEGLLDDDVFGIPSLERVWNLLDDLDKVTGGGAEAFWLRANQGLHLDVDKDMALDSTTNTVAELKEQMELYKHQLTRALRTRGVTVETLGSDVANFESPADAILTQIAGAKGMPKRILTGSEMGELASSQDRDNWKDQINGRQTSYVGPYIVRPLADRLIEFGYLPAPAKGKDKYEVRWPHIQTLTEQEKADGAQKWAGTTVANEPVFTDAEIRDKWYAMPPLSDEQRKEIADRKAEALKMQQEAMAAAAPPEKKDEGKGKFPRAAEEYKYGSTQIQLPADIARRLFALGAAIPDEDLAPDGREADAHITVKYGLLEPNAMLLSQVVAKKGPYTPTLAGFGAVRVTLGKTSFFSAPDHDVVFVTVDSQNLVELNRAICASVACAPSDYVEYVPHATVAYVKPGLGPRYAGLDMLEGREFTVGTIVMTDTEGRKVEISLKASEALGDDAKTLEVLAAAIAADDEAVVSSIIGVTHRVLGDLPGHEFHGNQWTDGHGSASSAHESARDAHRKAEEANQRASRPGASAREKEIADSLSSKADQASREADAKTQGIDDKGMTRVREESTAARYSAEEANRANGETDNPTSHDFSRAAHHHASAMIAHREAATSHKLHEQRHEQTIAKHARMSAVLSQAKDAHTKFEKDTGKPDEDWAGWYAGFVAERTGVPQATIKPLITEASKIHTGADWPDRYAEYIVGKLAKHRSLGDIEGHEFHGNQWTGGMSNTADSVAARQGLTQEEIRPIVERIRREATTEAERKYADEMAVAEALANRDLRSGDTKGKNTNVDGSYTAERLAVQNKAFDQFFQDHLEKFGRLPSTENEHPTVTFMSGLPGAGKSTAAMDLQKNADLITIDPDTMKRYLPEYNGGLGGTVVQRESGDMADRLMEYAYQRRMNILIDGTMKTSGSPMPSTMSDGALGKMAAFKEGGYRVEVRFVDVTVDESIQNTVTRFHEQFAKTGSGRYVPPSATRAMADDTYGSKPRASLELAKHSSYKGKPLMDAYVHTRGYTGGRQKAHYVIEKRGSITKGGINK